MKRQAAVALLAAVCAFWAAGWSTRALNAAGKCTDIPLRFTLYNDTTFQLPSGDYLPSAIRPDGGGEYTNGGTTSAEIKVCAGTNDAVLNLSTGKRKFVLAFPPPIAGSVIDGVPSWVPGQIAVNGWINVRNLIFRKGDNTPFTTHVGSTFNSETYRLGFMQNPVEADPNIDPARLIEDNSPRPSSAVTVYPAYPPECTSGSRPTWLVKGQNANADGVMQVGTLYKIPLHGAHQQQGQYSMPFEMRIDALACFTYP